MNRKDLNPGATYLCSTPGGTPYEVTLELVEPYGSAIVVYTFGPAKRVSYTTTEFALMRWSPID